MKILGSHTGEIETGSTKEKEETCEDPKKEHERPSRHGLNKRSKANPDPKIASEISYTSFRDCKSLTFSGFFVTLHEEEEEENESITVRARSRVEL